MTSGDIFWIEFSKQPEFKRFPLKPGDVMWVYYASNNREFIVTALVSQKDTKKKKNLPAAEPIEIEEKNYRDG